ncbi:hypothetical protein [Agriterribacter sp.]|uniref:hypothetical protein n=1 Tax=Agriterribacter sp. TaxID=2821509 RepID=UPI002C989C7B|nr:hypothetical protein [Agriterribacter sp.]HTN06069.1 hypothetical protein [Agriterribacter sp.]
MRKIILIAMLAPALAWGQKTTLEGRYQESPVKITTDKQKANTWQAVVDFFITNGISITTADKQSGLIVATDFSFIKDNQRNERKGKIEKGALFTYEEDGKPTNPDAWVVLNKLVKGKIYPVKLTGNLNVYISDSTVTVSVTNLKGESNNDRDKWRFFQVKSTGVFEKQIADIIKYTL